MKSHGTSHSQQPLSCLGRWKRARDYFSSNESCESSHGNGVDEGMGALSSLTPPPALPLPPRVALPAAGRPRAVGIGAVRHFPLRVLGSDISQRKFPGSLSHAGILL